MKFKEKFKSYSLITLGVFALHIGFYFFLQPIGLVIGGMMGVSMLLEPMISISVGTIYFVLNIVALILGATLFGKEFFVRTIYATILAPLLVSVFELLEISDWLVLDQIDQNNHVLIAALGGGVLVGLGIGLVLRNNATTGGMDVFQKAINQYLKVPFTVAVYVTDGIIILFGMLVSFQNGIFAIFTMFITAFMINKTAIMGRSAFALMIISEKTEEIKKYILKDIDRGLTFLKATGGYTGHEKELVITTVNRQELYMLKDKISELDPKAFTLIFNTKEVLGDGFHRNDIS
ncbi:YitT family protein [Acholeplasma equirhinis]|uniref:YitT family protein n=1 Tax=Acholeplasma equirhinis TaxID=555393 RepID=UPI00197AD283|nr:YitT family protein [Acholeplasma equirhinis]MBN3490680.1 YitT family protein [Acholeplasma equirhinis]